MCIMYSRSRYPERRRPEGLAPPPGPADATPQDATPVDAPDRDPRLRVSQAERDEVASVLARHYADGRLTLGEYEERVAAALEARTGADLDALLTDLPAPAPSPHRPADRVPPAPPAGLRPAPGRDERPSRAPGPDARRGVPALAGVHLSPATARALAITAVIVLASVTGMWALWLLWPAIALTGGGSCARLGGGAHRRERVTIDA